MEVVPRPITSTTVNGAARGKTPIAFMIATGHGASAVACSLAPV